MAYSSILLLLLELRYSVELKTHFSFTRVVANIAHMVIIIAINFKSIIFIILFNNRIQLILIWGLGVYLIILSRIYNIVGIPMNIILARRGRRGKLVNKISNNANKFSSFSEIGIVLNAILIINIILSIYS